MITVENNFSASFYRKLLLAHLISIKGNVNQRGLAHELGWPLRTVQDNLKNMKDISIQIDFIGSAVKGHYTVTSWGVHNPEWVAARYDEILEKINLFISRKK